MRRRLKAGWKRWQFWGTWGRQIRVRDFQAAKEIRDPELRSAFRSKMPQASNGRISSWMAPVTRASRSPTYTFTSLRMPKSGR